MLNAFRDGGFWMIPTFLFGLALLAAALRYAITPNSKHLGYVLALGATTILAGGLGFVTGVVVSANAAASANENAVRMFIAGTGESLNNVALSLVAAVLASLLTTVGVFRKMDGQKNGSPATKPAPDAV